MKTVQNNVLWRLCDTKLNYKLIKSSLNESESLFLFLAIFGKVVLLRSVRGKLYDSYKMRNEESSLIT